MNRLWIYFLTILVSLGSASLHAEGQRSLHDEILEMDRQFFEAFNRCNLDVIADLFADDLEFFHDTAGLSDYEGAMQASVDLCARNLGLVRTLDANSMKVYPVPGYGAIQEAEHTFCHPENGKPDCGTFKFVHVWRKTDGQWQIARVLSYGH